MRANLFSLSQSVCRVAGRTNPRIPYLCGLLQCHPCHGACACALQNAMRCITLSGDKAASALKHHDG
jgi:hypothetical protein